MTTIVSGVPAPAPAPAAPGRAAAGPEGFAQVLAEQLGGATEAPSQDAGSGTDGSTPDGAAVVPAPEPQVTADAALVAALVAGAGEVVVAPQADAEAPVAEPAPAVAGAVQPTAGAVAPAPSAASPVVPVTEPAAGAAQPVAAVPGTAEVPVDAEAAPVVTEVASTEAAPTTGTARALPRTTAATATPAAPAADVATPAPDVAVEAEARPVAAAPAPAPAPAAAGHAAAPALAPAAPAAPTTAPAPVAAPAPAPAPEASVPLAEQLGARLRHVGGLGAGTHVLTVPVDPENLGPVRVVAHITGDAVRLELLGAGEQSREALRASLQDLRRDLQSAGLQAEIGLGGRGDGGGARGEQTGRDHAPGTPAGPADRGRTTSRTSTDAPAPTPVPARPGALDLVV